MNLVLILLLVVISMASSLRLGMTLANKACFGAGNYLIISTLKPGFNIHIQKDAIGGPRNL